MNIFVFDIETIPDINAGRKLYALDNLSDADVAMAMFAKKRESSANDFLPLHLHRVIAISAVLRTRDTLKVWSLGDEHSSENEIIQRFYDGIEKFTPTLVTWNGSGFDLPVLHYRGLLHGVNASRYFEMGETDQNFKWNNYLNRFHYRHMDLMDILAAYQGRANAPLDQIALLLGFPGKMGMSGSKVWEYYLRGELTAIRNYCETDVLNTYLVFLRFELMRGNLTHDAYHAECEKLKALLRQEAKSHFNEFLTLWVPNV
jgi:predicted PolB exonuclease-like 3'-5' exonuclease